MIVCIAAAEKATTSEFFAQVRYGFSVFEKRARKLSSPWCVGINCWVLNWPVTSNAAENIQTNGKSENAITTAPMRWRQRILRNQNLV